MDPDSGMVNERTISTHAYQRIVNAILSSPPDHRVGCQQWQLLEHIRDVFDYDDDLHEEIIRKEELNKPTYELQVHVLEARSLPSTFLTSKPYCVITTTVRQDEDPFAKKGFNCLGHRLPSEQPAAPPPPIKSPTGKERRKKFAWMKSTDRMSSASDTSAAKTTKTPISAATSNPAWSVLDGIDSDDGERRGRRRHFSHSDSDERAGGVASCACNTPIENETPRWEDQFLFHLGDNRLQFVNVYVSRQAPNLQPSSMKDKMLPLALERSASGLSANIRRFRRDSALVDSLLIPPHAVFANSPASSVIKGLRRLSMAGKTFGVDGAACAFISLKDFALDQWHDKWFSLANGKKPAGVLHVRFRIFVKQKSTDISDDEHRPLSITELIPVIHGFHTYNAVRQQEEYESTFYSGDLMESTEVVLEQTVAQNHICLLSMRLISLAVLLDWETGHTKVPISDKAVELGYEKLSALVNEVGGGTRQCLDTGDETIFRRIDSKSMELHLFSSALIRYLDKEVARKDVDRQPYFPPLPAAILTQGLGRWLQLLTSLCRIEVCSLLEEEEKPFNHLRKLLRRSIESDTTAWLNDRLLESEQSQSTGHSSTPPSSAESAALCRLTDVLLAVGDVLATFLPQLAGFFRPFLRPSTGDGGYPAVVFGAVDGQLAPLCEQAVQRLTVATLRRLHRCDLLDAVSKQSMQTFDAVKRLVAIFNEHDKDSNRVYRMSNYEPWFSGLTVFWTYSWKDTSFNYTLKALRQDRQLVQAADDVNFAESVVNVLQICKGLCDDFTRLGFQTAQSRLICTIKLTDIICDNVVGYARYLHKFLLQQSSGTSRISRAANSIEHAGIYIRTKVPEFLAFSTLFAVLDSEEERQMAENTLNKLLANAQRMTHFTAAEMLSCMIGLMESDIERFCSEITKNKEQTRRSMRSYMRTVAVHERADALLNYLAKVCSSLIGALLPSLYPPATRRLWDVTQHAILKQLQHGQTPDYYQQILQNVYTIREYFTAVQQYSWEAPIPSATEHDIKKSSGASTFDATDDGSVSAAATGSVVDADGVCPPASVLCQPTLIRRLYINAQSTADLLLDFGAEMVDQTEARKVDPSSTCYFRFKFGYRRITNERVSIGLKVMSGHNLPRLDAMSGLCDPYVRMELFPPSLFPGDQFPPQATEVVRQTLNPVYDEIFHFDIPESLFFTNGTALLLTALDLDTVSSNDVAGQAYIPLAKIPRLLDGEGDSGGSWRSSRAGLLQVPSVDGVGHYQPGGDAGGISDDDDATALDCLPTCTVALELLAESTGASYQVMKERTWWDDEARRFVAYQQYVVRFRSLPPEAHDRHESYHRRSYQPSSSSSVHQFLQHPIDTVALWLRRGQGRYSLFDTSNTAQRQSSMPGVVVQPATDGALRRAVSAVEAGTVADGDSSADAGSSTPSPANDLVSLSIEKHIRRKLSQQSMTY